MSNQAKGTNKYLGNCAWVRRSLDGLGSPEVVQMEYAEQA